VQKATRLALAMLAIGVLAMAIYVVARNKTVPQAGQTPGATEFAPSSSIAPSTPTPTPTTSAPAKSKVVAFLGDDWTAGVGASVPAHRFTALVCATLHCDLRVFGLTGAGYAKSSSTGGTYADAVAMVAAAHPDVVVVCGGRNDSTDDGPTLATAITTVYSSLRTHLPNATLIGVAPMWGDSDLPSQLATMATEIKTAVTSVGGHYLDIPDPIHGRPEWMQDASDPNDSGYAAIAAALTTALTPYLAAAAG
jgi:lysophospholipase L1-like esterase